MEASAQRAPFLSGIERLAVVMFFLLLVGAVAWPAARICARAGFLSLSRPFLSIRDFSRKAIPSKLGSIDGNAQDRMARLAHSMEFRIRQYPVDSSVLKNWSYEWKLRPSDNLLLLRPLLAQLSSTSSRESDASRRNDLIQTILQVSADTRTAYPNNPIPSLAESLALFYSGQDALSLHALRQSQVAGKITLGLHELNQSENVLWHMEISPSSIFPVTPRSWNLDMERTLYLFSRSLALQERTLLQKYNIEKAVDITLLHLTLASQIRDIGWGPADFALAKGIAQRALLPYWKQKGGNPSLSQLGDHFARFLEDQGDPLAPARVRAILEDFKHQQIALEKNLSSWREIQGLGNWSPRGVLACLFLQTLSLLLAWITIVFFTGRPSILSSRNPEPISAFGFSGLPFALPPLVWAISNRPPGSVELIAGLLIAWAIWIVLLKAFYRSIDLLQIRSLLAQSMVTMNLFTLLFLMTLSFIFQSRADQLRLFLEHGWLK